MSECRPTTGEELHRMQGWPFTAKVWYSQKKIREFYERSGGKVYVSFSGGKDSTVLLHMVRNLFPEVPAVFFNTGLEYPELRAFVRSTENVVWINPTKSFKQVLANYGYPVVSKEVSQKVMEIRTTGSDILREKRLHGDARGNGKLSEKWEFLIDAPFPISHRCCDVMKKAPAKRYEKASGRHPITGIMAEDPSSRAVSYMRRGCNSFKTSRPMSTPFGFWTTADVWQYIRVHELAYAPIYDKAKIRSTGCIFCPFGVQREQSPNRFQQLQRTHPKLWRYCIEDLEMGKVLDYLHIPYKGEADGKP